MGQLHGLGLPSRPAHRLSTPGLPIGFLGHFVAVLTVLADLLGRIQVLRRPENDGARLSRKARTPSA